MLMIATSSDVMLSLTQWRMPPAQTPARPARGGSDVISSGLHAAWSRLGCEFCTIVQAHVAVTQPEGKAAIQAAAVQAQQHGPVRIRGLLCTVEALTCAHTDIAQL